MTSDQAQKRAREIVDGIVSADQIGYVYIDMLIDRIASALASHPNPQGAEEDRAFLETLKGLHERATKAPWNDPKDGVREDEDGYVFVPECTCIGPTYLMMETGGEYNGFDFLFVRAVRDAFPRLYALAHSALDQKTGETKP